MKKLPQHLDDLLMEYIDGSLSHAERTELENSLLTNPDLQQRLAELKAAHATLKGITWDEPSRNFTTVVMGRLNEKPSQAHSIRNGLLLLLGIVLIMAIAIILVAAGVFDASTTIDVNDVSLVQRYLKQNIPSFSIDAKRVVNVIVLLNLILAFIVLDRAILKPIFQRRIQAGH